MISLKLETLFPYAHAQFEVARHKLRVRFNEHMARIQNSIANGYICRECNTYNEMCVVHDELWEQIHKPQRSDITLCMDCMETRLGRAIQLKDLKLVNCNRPYFLGNVMN